MNYTHLNNALVVLQTKSISKAAQQLLIAQPNLSRELKDLESEIGFPLFIRSNTGVVPTAKGEEFLMQAKSLLSELNALEERFKSKQEFSNLSIAIPHCPTLSNLCLGYLNKLQDAKRLSINLKESHDLNLINEVSSNALQLAIVRVEESSLNHTLKQIISSNLKYQILNKQSNIVLLATHHPLANEKQIYLKDLKEYPRVMYHEQTNVNNHKVIKVNDRASAYDALTNFENTYLIRASLPLEMHDNINLVIKPLLPQTNSVDILVYDKVANHDLILKQLINYILQKYQRQF